MTEREGGLGRSPWADGPQEILDLATRLLDDDTEASIRLAMIVVDNAVELIIGTYLGLPTRVTGIRVPRRRLEEASQSFPDLLDALEEFASDRLTAVPLGDIEWYHRLRNQLYHNGNGLTVARRTVEVYVQIATALFESLFGAKLAGGRLPDLNEFLNAWAELESSLARLASRMAAHMARSIPAWERWDRHHGWEAGVTARMLGDAVTSGIVPERVVNELVELRELRNAFVHLGSADVNTPQPDRATIDRVRALRAEVDAVLLEPSADAPVDENSS